MPPKVWLGELAKERRPPMNSQVRVVGLGGSMRAGSSSLAALRIALEGADGAEDKADGEQSQFNAQLYFARETSSSRLSNASRAVWIFMRWVRAQFASSVAGIRMVRPKSDSVYSTLAGTVG